MPACGIRIAPTNSERPRRRTDARSKIIPLDVCDEQSVKKAVAQVLEREGRIDVLVNNAGIAPMGPLEEVDDAEVKAFSTRTCLACCAAFVRCCLPCESNAAVQSSISVPSPAVLPPVASGVYAASKFALEGLSESLAQEVKPFGIHVALVKPGFIVTPIIGKALETLPSPEKSAYPNAVRISNAPLQSATKTGGPPEMVAATIEEAMNDRTSRLRYPVGEPARALLAARADMSEEEWVDLGRHESLEAYFGELLLICRPSQYPLSVGGTDSEAISACSEYTSTPTGISHCRV